MKKKKRYDKKVLIVSIILLILLVSLIIFIIYKKNKPIIEEETNVDNYRYYIVNSDLGDMIIKDYETYKSLSNKLNVNIDFNKNVFEENIIFLHFEKVKMCDNDLNKNVEVTVCSNQTGIAVRRTCCDNPETKIVAFFELFNKEINDVEEIMVYNHDIYNSCK